MGRENKTEFGAKVSFPSWIDLLAIVGVFFIAQMLCGFGKVILDNTGSTSPEFSMFLAYTVALLISVAFALYLKGVRSGKKFPIKLGLVSANPALVLWGVVMTFAVGVVVEPLLGFFPEKYMEMMLKMVSTGGWSFAMTVVCAPILEELLFRGVIQSGAQAKWGKFGGILISAAIFGAIHIIPQQVVNAFFIGIVLGYIYMRTQSLFAVILIHAINNAVAYLSISLSGGKNITTRDLITNDTLYYIVYGVFAITLVVSTFFLVQSLRAKNSVSEQ